MDAVNAYKETQLLDALHAEDPTRGEACEAYSSGGPVAGDFLLPPLPGAPGTSVMMMSEDEFVTALRARLRIPYPAFLPRFQRERGVAQHCNHQYSSGSKVCGHRLVRVDGTPDAKGIHQQLCNVGGGVDRRHNSLRDWLWKWLLDVCHVPWAQTEQHVPEWDKWVPAKDEHGVPKLGPQGEPVQELLCAKLDVAFRDEEGVQGYVDVAYTNATGGDAATTYARGSTAGKAASEREDQKRRRYPPALHPHAEMIPFVVEARGRVGAEVLPFLRQHAPEDSTLRSAVLARATRELSIITQRGLAALLLAAEPRPGVA